MAVKGGHCETGGSAGRVPVRRRERVYRSLSRDGTGVQPRAHAPNGSFQAPWPHTQAAALQDP